MNYRIIDISQDMSSYQYSGNPKLNVDGPHNRVSGSNPEYVYDISFCTQSGTHIQASHYFLKTGKTIDRIPLEKFEGEAFIITFLKEKCDLESESLKDGINSIDLQDKILLVHTGFMEKLIEGKVKLESKPGLSFDTAKYLVEEKKIKMIGIDSIGLESVKTKNYVVNKYLCEREVLILEGLVNLDSVKSDKLWLEAFPLKIEGVEGTPCRAILKEYFD